MRGGWIEPVCVFWIAYSLAAVPLDLVVGEPVSHMVGHMISAAIVAVSFAVYRWGDS